MSQFHDFLLYKSLAIKFDQGDSVSLFANMVCGPNGETLTEAQIEEALEVTQVCAKLPRHLSTRLDQISNALGCTKRQFMEYALQNACDEAALMLEETGVMGAVKS